jgi:hypothetical protein
MGPDDELTFEALVARVGRDRYDQACRWAWQTAAGTGSRRERPASPEPQLEDVPHDLADLWFEDGISLSTKLDLALRVYAEMPGYATLMYVKSHYEDLDGELRDRLWTVFRAALESDDRRVADPVAYCVWVDFFEDQSTVDEAWIALTPRRGATWERRIERVLDAAGPVPWPHKEALFEELAGDSSWHPHILGALIGSAFDVYGQMDVHAARRWLGRLRLRRDEPGLKELRERLAS